MKRGCKTLCNQNISDIPATDFQDAAAAAEIAGIGALGAGLARAFNKLEIEVSGAWPWRLALLLPDIWRGASLAC